MHALVHDAAYQQRLRADFCRRRIHPTSEVAIWNRVLGPATQTIAVSADLTLDARLAEERELFSRLSVEQLEQLAAESQSLVDKARAMVQANIRPMLVGVSPPPTPGVHGVVAGEPADQSTGTMVTDRPDTGAASVPDTTP